jgi:hypothetical protein
LKIQPRFKEKNLLSEDMESTWKAARLDYKTLRGLWRIDP